MIKPIIHDRKFLSELSEIATIEDLPTATDLKDTLAFHKDKCVGMAANMIGIKKRIIVVEDMGNEIVMFNPEILKRENPYMTKEGCLSLVGQLTEVVRFENIRVKYRDEKFKQKIKDFSGITSQIIQHEIDHCDGTLV